MSTGIFKKKLVDLELGFDQRSIELLVHIVNENLEASITMDEYYAALETYNVSREKYSPFLGRGTTFQKESLIKLLTVMEEKNYNESNLWELIEG